MSESLFSLKNVSYSYPGGIPALSDFNLEVNKGDRIAIIGANGTGKSTTLTMLDALIFPEKGSFKAFGTEINEKQMNKASFQNFFRERVGFVFQNPDIQLFCPTVKEDILFGPLQLDLERDVIIRNFEKVVDLMHVSHLLERSPHQLSIGEKKKAAIASVLIMDPQVLLLDEPTAGLDPQTTRDIIKVLYDAHKDGKTVIMATHDLHIVGEIADTIHVFGRNKGIIRSGSADEILDDTIFLEENNLVHKKVHRT